VPAIESHTVYPDEQLAKRIEQRADEMDVSVSEFYREAARDRLAEVEG